MFRLNRIRNRSSEKLGKRVEFNFSDLCINKVPKGWEKLMVSIVGVESGKTVAKSSKVAVRNGTCQWSDVLRESVVVSHQEDKQCLYKIVVSTGLITLRHGILGEALMKLTDYLKQQDSTSISLNLDKCSQDTVLQFKVRCLSTEGNFRAGNYSRETSSIGEEYPDVVDIDDVDIKSDESDSMLNRSVGSFSSSHLEEYGNKFQSISASESHHSSDSSELLTSKTKTSPKNSMNVQGLLNNSITSQNGGGDNVHRSSHSSFNSKTNNGQTTSLRHSDSSKEFLEAAQETIEELRGESRMWEKTARKLKDDNDALKKEITDHSKHSAKMDLECDSLKLEVMKLKQALDESYANQSKFELSKIQEEGEIHRKKELEDEIRFQKESQTSLAHQLKKTQESNIELLVILQELEETIEKQRQEIENISKPNDDMDADLKNEVESLKSKIQDLERDCANLTEENFKLAVTMKETTTTWDDVNASGPNSQLELEEESEYKEILIEGVDKETTLTIQFHELEKKCSHLEVDLQFFKDKANELGFKLQRSLMELEEQSVDLVGLQQELENQRDSGVASAKKLEAENVKLSQCLSGSERKFQGLSAILDASRQSEEILKADIEDMRRSLDNAKLKEEQSEKTVSGLELNIKASEYEIKQLKEEIFELKSQLQKIPDLQGEIRVLESTLQKATFEKSELENSLHLITDEYEKIKAENKSYMEKFADGEEAKLVGIKTSPEALDTEDAEIRNEIERIMQENSQYQTKIDRLEEEKDAFAKKLQELEKEYKLQREINKKQIEDNNNGIHLTEKSGIPTGSVGSKSPSSLEVELKDMQERYLQMSLRYAEVEAQREDLVMKLKSSGKKEKSWFS